MVYEDALTILSYASPYEVIVEAKSGKLISSTPGQGGQPSHPVYRSSSFADLYNVCGLHSVLKIAFTYHFFADWKIFKKEAVY